MTLIVDAAEKLPVNIDEVLNGGKKYEELIEQRETAVVSDSVYADSMFKRTGSKAEVNILVREKKIIGYLVFIKSNNTKPNFEEYEAMIHSVYSDDQFDIEVIQKGSNTEPTVFKMKDKILYPKAIESFKAELIEDLKP